MPLVIEIEEAEELARELVRLTGETTADAVARALRERFERLHRARSREPVAADELDKVALHCAMLPVLDQRSADEIANYDENGLPD